MKDFCHTCPKEATHVCNVCRKLICFKHVYIAHLYKSGPEDRCWDCSSQKRDKRKAEKLKKDQKFLLITLIISLVIAIIFSFVENVLTQQ